MRSTLVTIVLAVTISLSLFCDRSLAGIWVCRPCESEAECDELPTTCDFGFVRDACNRIVCAKGPGDRCGGALDILGRCAEGLMCKSDEICHGCDLLNLRCFE